MMLDLAWEVSWWLYHGLEAMFVFILDGFMHEHNIIMLAFKTVSVAAMWIMDWRGAVVELERTILLQ